MKPAQEYINQLFLDTSSNIHQVYYGYKITNNKKTNIPAIVFGVFEKKEKNQLLANEIIPSSVNINNQTYSTDVIQIPHAAKILSSCGTQLDSTSEDHRKYQRPLIGGISIGDYDDGTINNSKTGTLGGIVTDMEDNNIVGLTNAHVLLDNVFLNSNRTITSYEYNVGHRKVSQPSFADRQIIPYGGFFADEYTIGFIKRYYPLDIYSFNKIDACIHTISYINTDISFKQLGLDNSAPLPFATTEEIDSILDNPKPKLLKSGRSTGYIGTDCDIEAVSTNADLMVEGYVINNDTFVTLDFSELIKFSYTDDSDYVAAPGDSGSLLLCDFNGTIKIIGLIFAGSSESGTMDKGYANRIDNVASMLNLSSWDGINIKKYNFTNHWQTLITENLSSEVSFVQDEKKYWQVGTILDNEVLKNFYIYYGGIEDDTEEPPKPQSIYGSGNLLFDCTVANLL